MASHKNKDVRKFISELERVGWVSLGGRNHFKIRSPGGTIVSMSNSPSCPYMLKHVMADVNRVKQNELRPK